jgi:uncharacterized membrane protein
MASQMRNLVLAALFLPLSHFLIASTPLRGVLVRPLGERIYSSIYSLIALAAFVWLILAYREAPVLPLWNAPRWLQVAVAPLMLLASILVVAGLTTPNPVIVRSDSLFGNPGVVRGVLRISRNPFFWGAGIFSINHNVRYPVSCDRPEASAAAVRGDRMVADLIGDHSIFSDAPLSPSAVWCCRYRVLLIP